MQANIFQPEAYVKLGGSPQTIFPSRTVQSFTGWGDPLHYPAKVRDQAGEHNAVSITDETDPRKLNKDIELEKSRRERKMDALQEAFRNTLSDKPWPRGTLPREIAEKIWGHSKERPA